MSKQDILEYFYNTGNALSAGKIFLILLFSLLAGMVIFFTYKLVYSGVNYNAKFNSGNVMLVVITSVIMIMISSNIVISLGMVGALSIVRFRTAIKDPRDTIFIFWSIVEGLAIGSQNYLLGAISTLFIAVVMLIMSFISKGGERYIVIIRGTDMSPISMEKVMASMSPKMRNNNFSDYGEEIVYQIKLKSESPASLMAKLKSQQGVSIVSIIPAVEENLG